MRRHASVRGAIGVRRPGSLRSGAVLGGVLVLATLLTCAGVAPASTWADPAIDWSNGLVLCEFDASLPTVSVSALARAQTGLSVTVTSISEVDPAGDLVASSNLSSAAWTYQNLSTEDAYDLEYTAAAPVITVSSAPGMLPSASVRVDYVLPAYAGSPSGPEELVATDLAVSNWPWQADNDHLVLTLAFWPSFPDSERLALGVAPASLVSGVSIATGATFEEWAGGSTAGVNAGGANATNVSATPTVAGSSASAAVTVVFGATAGAFAELNYSGEVRVLFPSSIAGIPTPELLLVGGTAALAVVGVAVGARVLRRRPSDLVYVDRDDQ